MSDNQIIDASGERKYFTMLPNMVVDMGLSPYAIALYCRIRYRAGERGECFENTRNLAKGCKMGAGQVSRAKKELEKAGLIHIETMPGKHGGRAYHTITIVDIWLENMKRCTQGQTSPSSTGELASSHGEPNKNPLNSLGKNSQKESEGAASRASTRDSAESISLPDERQEKGAAERASLSGREKTAPVGDCDSTFQDTFKELRKHPAIVAIKKTTGYYPKRSPKLYQNIIEKIGDNPDMDRLERCFATWCQKGYNPQNWEWVFEWYGNDMYYVAGAIRQ